MESRIQDLTDKIYKEGVEKAQHDAEELLAAAKKEAEAIKQKAVEKANSIVEKAEDDATKLTQQTHSELKMYAAQAVNALKTEIANLLSDKVTKESVDKFLGDDDAVYSFLTTLASNWSSSEELVISTSEADKLTAYFKSKASHLLENKVTIEQVNGLKTNFSISPADGSYKINFGDEELKNYFISFLRPQLVELLFADNN